MFKSMMYCSTKETNASNMYRLATILFFKKKIQMCINIKPHSFLNFSGCKWGNSIFVLTHLSILKSEAGLRSKGAVFWEAVEA